MEGLRAPSSREADHILFTKQTYYSCSAVVRTVSAVLQRPVNERIHVQIHIIDAVIRHLRENAMSDHQCVRHHA